MHFFKRDIFILLLVSILIGTAAAKAVSYGANIYFQQTLTSLVGDYGEYDLLLQIREDYKEEGGAQLDKILKESFAGASYKEGPAIIGKANFFIALPAAKKNAAIYENLDKLFSGVPGISGVSVLTEPRLNVRGVPAGAAVKLEEELKAIEGVDFVYRSGGSIGIVLQGTGQIAAVTRKVEDALIKNKIIDVSFPVGIEPDNPVLLAETISRALYRQLQPQTAQYVSVDTSNDDMVYLISTMQEIRRFLLTYATTVKLKPESDGKFAPGDTLVFQGGEEKEPAPGEESKRGNILVLITETDHDGTFRGVITQGDVASFQSKRGRILAENKIGAMAARATIENPRELLVKALQESAALMEKLPTLVKEGDLMNERMHSSLGSYSEGTAKMQSAVDHMDYAAAMMQNAAERLENINVQGIKNQLDQSSRSMNALLNALRLIRVFNPDVSNAMQSLESTQEKLIGLSVLLENMQEITQEAGEARSVLSNVARDGKSALQTLQNFEGSKAQEDLLSLKKQLDALAKTDFVQLGVQMRRLADQAPKLSDEEIYRSVQLMDKVIEGQVIPGKRLQIMVDRSLRLEQAKPIIYAALGHENASVYETDLGIIEPNLYLQFYQVLKEVQAVLAGLTSLVLTIIFLALDHTAVMSMLRSRRQRAVGQQSRTLSQRFHALWQSFFYAENLYGMAMGAVLLSMMFFLSGGGIPYVPWYVIPVLGAALGLGIAYLTEKITPVSTDEILAGQSLGLSFDEIMREIVIPSARPGILQRLNRRRLHFK